MADVQVPQELIVGPQTADDDVLRCPECRAILLRVKGSSE